MRRNKPLAVIAGVAMFALAACGGGGSETEEGEQKSFSEADEIVKNPDLQGPAPEIEGAEQGGTVTVYQAGDPGPPDLDPSNGWSVTGNSIQQGLTHRSLTQYTLNQETGQMELVPDLATDLGTPNEDFTEWKFTIRDDATWETGDPITPEEVAFGICRSMDSKQFPSGPGTEYSQTYFFGAGEYEGPYTGKDPKCEDWGGITVDGQDITIKMAKPFPDMDWWGSFMAMGPAPLGAASNPPDYGTAPLSNGPYKVESFRPNEELVLVKNSQWDPASDPARHQYVDKWVIKFNEDQNKVDQIMLSDNTESQTAISDGLGSSNYQRANAELGDRLVLQSAQCTSYVYPDYKKITDINVRKAIAWGIPYEDTWLAAGQVPGVTRVPANSIMPPGMAGKPEYFADGEQFTYNPEKAKALLEEAGYGADKPYPLQMIYYEVDPLQVDEQKQMTKGLEEAGFSVKAIPVQEDPYNIWTDQTDKLHKQINVQRVNWCSDWPSGLTMLPPLLKTGASYNTGAFSEQEIDAEMDRIPSEVPLDEQAAAWGALDEKVGTEYFPIIPTAFRNQLLAFGSKIGNGVGDPSFGATYFKGIYVKK